MPFIFRYFWFLFAAAMAINVLLWRRRLLIAVDRGRASRDEVDAFVRWLGTCLVGGGIAIGLTELAAGWSSPFCAVVGSAADVPHVVSAAIELGAMLILLLWVWRGNGADLLARIGPALGRTPNYDKTYPPQYVRAFVSFAVLVALASRVAAQAAMPPGADALACTTSPTAAASAAK